MSKHCRAKECPFIGCRAFIDKSECVDCALMVEDDPLEMAKNHQKKKEWRRDERKTARHGRSTGGPGPV